MAYDPSAASRNVDIEQQEVGASAERHVPAVRMPAWRGAHSRFPGHALTPTGVMAIRCKQFHLPDL